MEVLLWPKCIGLFHEENRAWVKQLSAFDLYDAVMSDCPLCSQSFMPGVTGAKYGYHSENKYSRSFWKLNKTSKRIMGVFPKRQARYSTVFL